MAGVARDSFYCYGTLVEANDDVQRLCCYSKESVLGNIEAFQQMFHCLHELGRDDGIMCEFFVEFILLHDPVILRVLCRILEPVKDNHLELIE